MEADVDDFHRMDDFRIREPENERRAPELVASSRCLAVAGRGGLPRRQMASGGFPLAAEDR
jgi:hypothetical protein